VDDVWRNPEKAEAILLLPDDYVLVPLENQVITIGGEVNNPHTLPFLNGRKLKDYLTMCGGITSNGDSGAVYLYDSLGNRQRRISLDYQPNPGEVFYVEKNAGAAILAFLNVSLPTFTTAATLILTINSILQLIPHN
jgi:protein involved in polysaccharide export with SLBB domain